jgi:acetyl-CoA synthetase
MLQPNAPSRRAYTRDALRRLLEPQSIALIGASSNPASLGGRTLANLAAFPGRLYPVNPRSPTVGDRQAWASISDLPEAPDCVVLAIPQESVEPVVAECARRGAGAVIVLASGYAELEDASGEAAQARLLALAAPAGLRVVGPNCVGVANRAHGLHAAFAEFSPSELAPGRRIGLVAQSGALGLSLSHGAERGMAISHVLTCGNSCDVDVADYVAALADDPHCDVIALSFEGLAAPERLREAALRVAAAGKRIAVCKLGLSDAGRAAARFHTHTAPGEPAMWRALFASTGMVVVERIEALMETAAFLAKAPGRPLRGPPAAADGASTQAGEKAAGRTGDEASGRAAVDASAGVGHEASDRGVAEDSGQRFDAHPTPQPTRPGVAIVSGSGGTGILSLDAAARHGVATPQPGAQTTARLRATVPAFGSPRNPCDATAQATRHPESLLECADAMLADPRYGALVIPWGRSQPPRLLAGLGALSLQHGKPICIVWMSQRLDGAAGDEVQRHPQLALFHSLDACMGALAAWL